jgi:hypothetical protein
MGLISYTLGIPNGPDNPSNDQPNMKTNNDNIAAFVAIDHQPFDVNNSGYHTDVHMIPQSPPVAIGGIGQLFSQNVTVNSIVDTQLFFKTGLNGLSQLTGNAAVSPGYQWIGGVLLKWGRNPIGAVSFSSTFPAFNHVYGLVLGDNSISAVPVSYSALTTSGFTLFSTGATNVFWLAIGD